MATFFADRNTVKTIRFIRGGEVVSLDNVPPTRTLLEVLREDLACTGTKEGCGEGDCGACTVVLGEPDAQQPGAMRFRAVNSCIRLAHSIDGMALWTVEDIAPTLVASRHALPPEEALRLRPDTGRSAAPAGVGEAVQPSLHPAQQAMVNCHASQCGFCTPGFVMSLFGMYQNHVIKRQPITRAMAQEELSGNLCRCTGYRPILDAAQQMEHLPEVVIDAAVLLQQMKLLRPVDIGLQPDSSYKIPIDLGSLLTERAAHPDAQLVAGCTDVGLWVTKLHMQFAKVIDVTQVRELRRVEHYPHHIAIGAAVSLADAFAVLVADRPQLHAFAARFAGLPVRNSGTLGGNVANGSPIGDSMPLLIALGASVVLMSTRGHREMPLEDLYTGYRKNVLAADEVLAWIKVPKAEKAEHHRAATGRPKQVSAPPGDSAVHPLTSVGGEFLKVYKLSKRYDDDISAVCLAINLHVDGGLVTHASIGAGGVAATPVRAVKTQAALLGQPWVAATVQSAMATLRAEFSPISDMRASSAYRVEVLGNLLQRYWLESQGLQQINLQSFSLEQAA